jgi:hypothetical protein
MRSVYCFGAGSTAQVCLMNEGPVVNCVDMFAFGGSGGGMLCNLLLSLQYGQVR